MPLNYQVKLLENEEANAVQVSYFSGRIERLNVSFTGEKVSKGTIISNYLFARIICSTARTHYSSFFKRIATCIIQSCP